MEKKKEGKKYIVTCEDGMEYAVKYALGRLNYVVKVEEQV